MPPPFSFWVLDTDKDYRKNSAQKTMHKMFGQDPRSLRPVNRDEQDNRFKPVYRRSRRGRKGSGQDSEKETSEATIKDETYTPSMSDTIRFEDMDTLSSPLPGSVYSMSMGSDMASPSTLDSMSPTGPIYSAFPYDGHENPLQMPFPGPTRSATVFSSSTEMSTDSVRGLRERLGISTNFAKQVTVLMNRLTISGSDPMPSPHRTASDIPMYRHGHPGPVPHPGLAVPGDFMVAQRYVHSCQGEKHFAKYLRESKCACWCTIADETSDASENFYVTANGEWCDRAQNVRDGIVEATCVDHFGNTPLHLFAALGCDIGVQTVFDLIESGRADPLAVNKADQTFLHVLSAAWFRKLGDINNAYLYRLLNLLWHKNASQALFRRDVYGRTFFHQLDRFVDDIQTFTYISDHYQWDSIPRDAFGVHPPSRAGDHAFPTPRRVGTTPLSPLAEEPSPDEFATKEQKLLTVINQAYTSPGFEDAEGRNGLHCLAELSPNALASSNPNSPNPEQPAASNGNKRKRKCGDKEADGQKPIERRAQYLSNLLLRNTEVTPPDVNHYDKRGRTVLMAFAAHLTDEQDKSGQHVGQIVDVLVERGARLEARNRLGETALLVAARHGNKHVVNRLAERGANLHARDKSGRGIMGILEAHLARCERNLPSYGRLEAVRGLVAKRLEETRGEDEPSFMDEWCGTATSRAQQ